MSLPVFHISVVALNIFSLIYDQLYVEIPFPTKKIEEMPFRARYIFLTIWCFILQTIYFLVSFLNDVFGTNEAKPKRNYLIRTLKDTIFSLAFPVALYVSISFWSIYFIDKELVFPEMVEKVFPVWLNHAMHTLVSVFVVTELLVTKRNYPSRTTGCLLTALFMVSYIVWMHILYGRTGHWPYPIFDVLNLPMRIVFCSSSATIGLGFYLFGEKLNGYVCPTSNQYYTNGASKKSKVK